MHASTQTKLVPAVVLPLVPYVVADGFLVSQLMYSLQVLFPKIDWIDRMIIAFKQHKNARRSAGGWSPLLLTWSFFLCWGGFHLSSMWLICQHEKTSHFVSICRTDAFSTGGILYQPVFWSGSSPDPDAPRHFSDNIGLFWLASRGVDDALFWKRRLEFVENAAGRNRAEPYILIPISKT